MDYFSHNPAKERITQIRAKMDSTKKQINHNLELLLNRGEKLEILVGQTESLIGQSEKFKQQSKRIQMVVLWRQAKYLAFLVCLALIIFWLFLSLFCGLRLRC